MAKSGTSLGSLESEITALKEALCAQQQLLQKLYNDLEMEREASATAASETLSMILRLQGEKAMVKMEANQYKRLAEEKMCHAEESLLNFEDLIYQKEMEIASLEYQVQAYKYKLLSLGCSDIGVCETKFPENQLQTHESAVGDIGGQSILRRNSMPSIPLKFSYQKKGTTENERSTSPDSVSKRVEENMNCELNTQISDMEKNSESSTAGDINSYWEQIRKLDERVREIAGVNTTNMTSGSWSSSIVSQVSTGLLLYPIKGAVNTKSGQIKHPEDLLENEATVDPSFSSNVLDVFEVPQIHESDKGSGGRPKLQRKLILEGNEMLGKPDSVPQEAVKPSVKNETDWLTKMFPSTLHKNIWSGPSDSVAVDCQFALVRPSIGVSESHSKYQQLDRTSEIIEVERHAAQPETSNRGIEELKLLKEIQEQLNSIQSEIRSWKTMKSSPSYELPLLSLQEAMLHFWL